MSVLTRMIFNELKNQLPFLYNASLLIPMHTNPVTDAHTPRDRCTHPWELCFTSEPQAAPLR